MKKLMLVAMVIGSLAISGSAQGASLILFSDLGRTATSAVVPVGGTYNIELFLQGDESDLGPAVEFRLVSSSADVQFLGAVWSNEIVLTLGDIVNGISLTSFRCLGYGEYGYGRNVVQIGTIQVRNNADADTFTVRVAGISDFDPLGTNCDAAFSAISIPGNEFLFNGVDTTHPTIRRIEPLSDTSLKLTFSEPILLPDLNATGNFALYETFNPQNVVEVLKAESHDQFNARLSVASPLVVGVSYTVWVSSAQDLAFNSIDTHNISFTMSDIMPPEVVAANIVDDEMLEDEPARGAVYVVGAVCLAAGGVRAVALPAAQVERAAIHLAAPAVFQCPSRKPHGPHGKDLSREAAQDQEPQRTARHHPAAVLEISAKGHWRRSWG